MSEQPTNSSLFTLITPGGAEPTLSDLKALSDTLDQVTPVQALEILKVFYLKEAAKSLSLLDQRLESIRDMLESDFARQRNNR